MAVNETNWLDAQVGVVGSMLISPDLVPRVLSQLKDASFTGDCLTIFQAIRALFVDGCPVDPVTVRDKAGSDLTQSIVRIMEETPTAANWQTYVDIVKRSARLRRLQVIGVNLMGAETEAEAQQLLNDALAAASERETFRSVTLGDAIDDLIDRRFGEKQPSFLEWPLPALNDQLFVERGDLIIIGGKPSSGKTAFALQAAMQFARSKRTAFFSLETSAAKLADRIAAGCCSVPMENIKRNALNVSHRASIKEFAETARIRSLPFDIVEASGASVADIQAYATVKQYEVIVIDYVQLLRASGASRVEQVTNISLELHRFAQSAGITIIALSQLSRDGAQNSGKKAEPDMSSLRESGQLEQDADVILLLYLEQQTNPNGRRILRCAKNKEGERFKMLLNFDGTHQTFSKAQGPSILQREIRNAVAAAGKDPPPRCHEQLELLPENTPVPFGE